jgi:hypothetical protein
MPVRAVLTQTLPAGVTVLDAGGAMVTGTLLTWSGVLSPEVGIDLQVRLDWADTSGMSLTLPGPVLSFWDTNTASGDVYTATSQTISSTWPLSLSYALPASWMYGRHITVLVTMTNLSVANAAQGVFTATVSAVNGSILVTTTRTLSITAGGTITFSISIPAGIAPGSVMVSGEVQIGFNRRTVFANMVVINGRQAYLPSIKH